MVNAMNNEIILGDNLPGSIGNMYIGAGAQKAIYSRDMQKQLDTLIASVKGGKTTNRAWVFEHTGGEFICRAGQSTKENARHYMKDENFILVHKED